jgi:hypothetical protein
MVQMTYFRALEAINNCDQAWLGGLWSSSGQEGHRRPRPPVSERQRAPALAVNCAGTPEIAVAASNSYSLAKYGRWILISASMTCSSLSLRPGLC